MITHDLLICFEQKHPIHLRKCKISIITAHRMCISTMLQCMHLCIYIVHVQGVDQKYFLIKLPTVLLYIDSIFTKQNLVHQ